MEFMLFIASDQNPDTSTEPMPDVDDWVEEGTRRGIRKQGDPLLPRTDARTVRVRDGETLIIDGPFTESKEWIVGYDLLECANIDEAIDYASRHPMARIGRIEVRAVMVFDE